MNFEKYINTDGISVLSYDTLPSTNTKLKEIAETGAAEKTVVIASHQSAGRGRMGRTFISPENTGIYMSILLRPELSAERSLEITTAAAVAACRIIKRHTKKSVGIKWVNDILIDGKKVCGILTEASVNAETARLNYVVLGIGLNLFLPHGGFPSEIADIATALFEGEYDRTRAEMLAGEIIDELFLIYPQIGNNAFVDEYRENSLILGKDIYLLRGDDRIPARALDIGDDYSLSVMLENGDIISVSSGDVSVRIHGLAKETKPK